MTAAALPPHVESISHLASRRLRVAIADDHALLRAGVRSVLSSEEDLEVVGEVRDGSEVPMLVSETHADVIVMDLTMPGCSGLEALHAIRAQRIDVGILIFTGHPATAYAEVLERCGVPGFLNKGCDPAEIALAVRAVGLGQRYFHDVEARQKEHAAASPPHKALTPRQLQMLTRFARGQSAGAVSAALGISIKSVTKHRHELFKHLSLRTNSQLTRYALRHRLME